MDCTFFSVGGAIYAFTTNVSITSSTFIDNSALRSGGAININGGSLHIFNSLFGYNSADIGTGGGLHIYAIFNSVSICDSRFLNNGAKISFEGSGGAIYVEGQSANVSLIDTVFNKNSADSCGALRVMSFNRHHNVSIINSNFVHNIESRVVEEVDINIEAAQALFGGVACINNSTISIVNSNFTENQAATHAGVLHIENSTLLIQGSNFSGNRAQRNGGVIFTSLSSVAIAVEQSSFTYNQAGSDGGAIYMRSVGKSSKVSARWSTFGFNDATRRGGMIAVTGGRVDIQESQFYNNTAESGGVVSACISEVKVQMTLWVMDDPTNPQLCSFYNTGEKLFLQSLSKVTTSPRH